MLGLRVLLGLGNIYKWCRCVRKENGRWFIRATNTGVTAFIDQNGHITEQAPIDKEFVLRGDLPAMQGQTL